MKIAFLDTVHSILKEGLIAHGHDCVDLTHSPKSTIEQSIHDFDGIVVRSRFPMDAQFLSLAKTLKFLARSGAGLENIDIPYCEKRNIRLFSAPEGNRNAVAEHALGMLLTLFNKIHTADAAIREGKWERELNRGIELDGKVVGIIGYGNNGAAFAQKLQGFNTEVLAYDKYKTGFETVDVQEVGLNEIFKRADIVSLHIPQNKETIELLDSFFISKMTKPFYLINLSRGKIINTSHLLNGIDQGAVLGACLDVLEFEKSSFENMFEEDLPETLLKLRRCGKVVLTPHVGGYTNESYFKLSKVLLEKITEYY